MFTARLAPIASLTLDWYTRHPALERVTIHCVGMDAEDVPVASLPANVQSAILALDTALAAHVAATTNLSCATDTPPAPEPLTERTNESL